MVARRAACQGREIPLIIVLARDVERFIAALGNAGRKNPTIHQSDFSTTLYADGG
jgi:hypothetical protein